MQLRPEAAAATRHRRLTCGGPRRLGLLGGTAPAVAVVAGKAAASAAQAGSPPQDGPRRLPQLPLPAAARCLFAGPGPPALRRPVLRLLQLPGHTAPWRAEAAALGQPPGRRRRRGLRSALPRGPRRLFHLPGPAAALAVAAELGQPPHRRRGWGRRDPDRKRRARQPRTRSVCRAPRAAASSAAPRRAVCARSALRSSAFRFPAHHRQHRRLEVFGSRHQPRGCRRRHKSNHSRCRPETAGAAAAAPVARACRPLPAANQRGLVDGEAYWSA